MLIELALISSAIYFFKHSRSKLNAEKIAIGPKKTFKAIQDILFGNERRQQQLAISSESNNPLQAIEDTTASKKYLLISITALGTALFSSVSPILASISVVAQFYLMIPFFYLVLADLKAGRVLTVYLEGIVIFLGMVAKGYLVLTSFMGIVGSLFSTLIQRTQDNAEKRLTNIFASHPSRVWIEKDGIEIEIQEVDFDTLKAGDVVIVHAGEVIPVDGLIQGGSAIIDQHLLTGESQPVERGEGERVFAATLMLTGQIHIKVEVAGEDTVAAKIGQVLNNTQNYKENLMARGKKIADGLLPVTWSIATVTWLLLGSTAALSVLFASLGLNMIVFGPLSVLTYLQILSRHGVLVKEGRILESLREVDTIVFDKTGTLTLEQPTVGQIHVFGDYDENSVLRFAAMAEYRQPHPIAKAILAKATKAELEIREPDAANYEVSYGIKVKLDAHTVCVGSARFMQREGIELPESIAPIQQSAEEQGYSLIYISVDQYLAGILEMHPSIRPEAADIIPQLKQRGFNLCIISGDHEQPTRNLANQLGIDRYFAETLPENKADLVRQLRDEGKYVCFIGDGINDAIALKSAQISISLKGASTAATDTAQIILMDGTLNHLRTVFQLSDEFENTMHNNFLTTIVPGVICIGGVYFLHFGLPTSMAIYYMGSAVGLSNSLLPLVKYQDSIDEIALEKQQKNADEMPISQKTPT